MAIDSHMHINSIVLNDEKKYIVFINNNTDIESVINVGLDLKSSKESINISELNSKFYSSVGIHLPVELLIRQQKNLLRLQK